MAKGRSTLLVLAVVSLLAMVVFLTLERRFAEPISLLTTGNSGHSNVPQSVGEGQPTIEYQTAKTSNVYELETFELINHMAIAEPTVDSIVARHYAYGLCEQAERLALSSKNDEQDLSDAERRSKAYVMRFSKSFCSGFVSAGSTQRLLFDELEALAVIDPEVKILSDAFSIDAETSNELARELKDELVRVVQSTKSPYIFENAGTLLMSDPYLMDGNLIPSPLRIHRESLAEARQFSSLLATCSRFPVCSSHSVFTVRACMPYQCDPAGGMAGYVRTRLNPTQFHQAQLYAKQLTGNATPTK